ncbi:MAG: acyltransferase family protein, partial [Actinomycetota bacterium]
AFDGLRGIAVLLVVEFHLRRVAPGLVGTIPRGGSLGVDVFFVLSGFLITALLLAEQTRSGRIAFGGFYRRRALRLLPALAVFLLAQIAFAVLAGIPGRLELDSVLAVVFYVANWKIVLADSFPPIADGLAQTWSLAVEEQFYLVWPIVFVAFAGLRFRLGTVLTILGAGVGAIAIARAILVQDTPPGLLYFRTDMRADALLVGAMAAHLHMRARPAGRITAALAWPAVAFVVGCVLFTEFNSRFLFMGGYTALAIAVAVVLLAVTGGEWQPTRLLEAPALRAVGRVAYGLYLWHYLVFVAVERWLGDWPVMSRIAVALTVTVAATAGSWRFVEQPFLRRKRRLGAG